MNTVNNPRLTIGIATFDDFDGVYFTLTSLMNHHREVMGDCEILVIDNNPASQRGRMTREWVRNRVPNGKYHEFPKPIGTAQARNEVFRQATGEAVLCLDSHVLLVPGAVQRLLEYYLANPTCADLLTGPLLSDSGDLAATHQRPQWSAGACGVWEIDERGRDPDNECFVIWQQGMGLFSCRRDKWVGFHPEFRGFGGCESYVMEKVRRSGGNVLCCPWLRWTHRFQRPHGVPYPVHKADVLRNYVIGFEELGLDTTSVYAHFRTRTNEATSKRALTRQMSKDVAVIGNRKYGGVRMRGEILAQHLGCKFIEPGQVRGMARRRTVIAIKNDYCAETIRRRCDRLVFDPLDSFFAENLKTDPIEYWRSKYSALRFDDIIATSQACFDVMRQALPSHVGVHLVPHQSDSGVRESWMDPDGPVVYAGLSRFVESGLERIQKACQMIGKRFVMGPEVDVLEGSSLVLSLRLRPYDSELNKYCKPQIKLENAAAAGIPAVSTNCPAAMSRFPNIPTVPVDFTSAQLADAMRQALDCNLTPEPFRDIHYLAAMDRLLSRESSVIYTAIFGGYDQLIDPAEPCPGARYVCFTDNPRLTSKVWQIRYVKPTGDPLMQAKRHKVLAHEVLDCDLSVWIDGRVEAKAFNSVLEQFRTDLALVKHPRRGCIYEEAEHCLRIRRGDPNKISKAIARYRKEGHPAGYGLWMGGVIIRRHSPATNSFNLAWWREIVSGTPRDQLALPVVLRRLGIRFDTLTEQSLAMSVGKHMR